MLPDYDCVVVGAGLVGAAQALALSQQNLKVVVIEARQPVAGVVGGDVRGLALAPSSRQAIEALGLWPRLVGQITLIRHIHVSDQGRFGFTRLSADDVDTDALGYVCPADHLLQVFESALIEQCDIRWGTKLVSIDTSAEFARIRLHDGSGSHDITARLVIGADGMQSRVRESLGAVVHQRDYQQHAVVANVDLQNPVSETAFERFTPSGSLALLPLTGGRHVVVRCCDDSDLERVLQLEDNQYLAELESGFGHRFGVLSNVSQRRAHKLVLQWADRVVQHRIALIGAAANTIHPNGAQGLNLGLRDAVAMALCIGRVQACGGDIGDIACLSEFAAKRSVDRRNVMRFTDGMAQVFSSKLPLIGVLRDAAMLATDICPLAKRSLIRRAAGLFTGPTLTDLEVGR